MSDIGWNTLQIAATGIIVALVAKLIRWLGRTRMPAELTEHSGRISPGMFSSIFTVCVGAAMVAGGLAMVFSGGADRVWGVALMVMGAFIGGFALPCLFSWHDVIWDDRKVNGAAKTFGPSLGRQRTVIEWPEIVKAGITVTQYWYIQADDGRRIYRSYLYPSWRHINDALSRHTGLTVK